MVSFVTKAVSCLLSWVHGVVHPSKRFTSALNWVFVMLVLWDNSLLPVWTRIPLIPYIGPDIFESLHTPTSRLTDHNR